MYMTDCLTNVQDLNIIEVDSLRRPAWVEHLLQAANMPTETLFADDLRVEIAETEDLRYIQAVLVDAIHLDSRVFQRRVSEVYAVLRRHLEGRRACYPLRFWNFIPAIHRAAHDGMVGYEVFNAGRFAAFSDWYRTPAFGPRMIAASGVGHHRDDFVVQVLAAEQPGDGLENPRQRAAYRYSKRYGPLPPCFARATLVGGSVVHPKPVHPKPGLMIIAGTASVVGEDSVHDGDLEMQVAETCLNLESLIAAAQGEEHRADERRSPSPLSLFRELRAYVVDERNQQPLVDLLLPRFPGLRHLELMSADLCRTDLMIEVEGVVDLAGNLFCP